MTDDNHTEAACLLQQGTSYRKRIGLKSVAAPRDPIFAGFKHGAFSIYFGDAPIYHFDLEGRWQRAFLGGTHYLKGLDATVQVIDRVREGPSLVLKRKTLADAEAGEFDARIRSMALDLIADLGAGRLARVEPPAQKAQCWPPTSSMPCLAQVSSWDTGRWFAHRQQYSATYGPLPFLPPECQNAVVLQATISQAGASGIGLSSDKEASARSPGEFEQHARNVAGLWGRRLLQSRVIFLAGDDVLHSPAHDVAAFLETAGRTFPIEPKSRRAKTVPAEDDDDRPHFDGVHVFLGNFAAAQPRLADWGDYACAGVSPGQPRFGVGRPKRANDPSQELGRPRPARDGRRHQDNRTGSQRSDTGRCWRHRACGNAC